MENEVITVDARAALALGSTQTEIDLMAMAAKAKAITAVLNTDGRMQCHAVAMTLTKGRTAIESLGKGVREDATKFSKAVIAEQNRLVALIEPEEKRLKELRDGWDAKIAAEKAAKELIERERIQAIMYRIAGIRAYAGLAAECRTSARVAELIDKLTADAMEGFEEFADDALAVRTEVLAAMQRTSDQKQADEAERARIKAEQEAEASRLLAEREALATEQAAETARREAYQVEQARVFAEQEVTRKAQAEQDRIQREQAAAELAAQRAEVERVDAERRAAAKAEADVQAAAMQAERDAFAKERADARAVQQAAADAIAKDRAALQRQYDDAEKAHAESAKKEADALAALAPVAIEVVAEIELAPAPVAELEIVTILKAEYERLLADSEWLGWLEAAGVDNWNGIDEARAMQREEQAENA